MSYHDPDDIRDFYYEQYKEIDALSDKELINRYEDDKEKDRMAKAYPTILNSIFILFFFYSVIFSNIMIKHEYDSINILFYLLYVGALVFSLYIFHFLLWASVVPLLGIYEKKLPKSYIPYIIVGIILSILIYYFFRL